MAELKAQKELRDEEMNAELELGPGDLTPRIKDNGYALDRIAKRREWIEERSHTKIEHIGRVTYDTETWRGNIENPIGVAQVPMGVAGPVLVHGKHAKGLFYVPMATTE